MQQRDDLPGHLSLLLLQLWRGMRSRMYSIDTLIRIFQSPDDEGLERQRVGAWHSE